MTSTASDVESGTLSRRHMGLAIFALAVGGFAIGTTEFMTMGVLPQVADGVHVSIPSAGHLISAYALGVVVGVPALSFFIAGWPRKGLLICLMVVYAAFNALSAAAQSYHQLLLARFFDGLPHGAYFGVASLVASSLVSPERRGRAIASVMFGLSVANLVGVPAATWLGQHAGWRSAYMTSAVLALLTVVMVWRFVPHMPPDQGAQGRAEARAFFSNTQVWLTMAAGAIGFGGLFATYSYISPIVTNVSGLGEGTVPIFVLGYGLGMVVGTPIAGELARWSVFKSLIASGVGTAIALVAFFFVAPHGWWLLPLVFLVTAISSVLTINLTLRLMDVAGDAVTLGAAMNHCALNIANALGAWIGGAVIAAGLGYRAPALAGAGLAALGVVVLLVSVRLHNRVAATERMSS
jgi:DHA1 family inner membrane transport protein